jgi:16S rRNA (guanine527-N7)-methyltransferase
MFHVKHEGWEVLSEMGIELGPEAKPRLERYERLLVDRAIPRGMIAASDGPRLRERHILDSIRAAPLLPAAGTVCDLGSGAGLPGIPLAIVRPDLRWVLVEVRRNRADFLEETSAELENVSVYPRRLETLDDRFAACTARAFASAPESWNAASRILEPDGFMIYWAGASFDPAADAPNDASMRLFHSSGLERAGPLVIMARQ